MKEIVKNLPLSEIYKQMALPQLEMMLRLKKMRPHSAENARRIDEVITAMKYVKAHGGGEATT